MRAPDKLDNRSVVIFQYTYVPLKPAKEGSEVFNKDVQLYVDTVEAYAKLHGYRLYFVDDILEQVVSKLDSEEANPAFRDFAKSASNEHTTIYYGVLKPLFLTMALQEVRRTYGCEVQYIFFLDIDAMILTPTRKLESFIHLANTELLRDRAMRNASGRASEQCAMIAQDGPVSVNTGVLFFRVAEETQTVMFEWMELLKKGGKYHHWNKEQGALQWLILLHIAAAVGKPPPDELGFDCFTGVSFATKKVIPKHMHNGFSVPEYASGPQNRKNLCWAGAMTAYLGDPVAEISRSVGPFCLFSGIHVWDRLQDHDQHISYDPLYNAMAIECAATRCSLFPSKQCRVDGLFIHHGKDESIEQNSRLMLHEAEKNRTFFLNPTRAMECGDDFLYFLKIRAFQGLQWDKST